MRLLIGIVLLMATSPVAAWASNVDWNLNVNVGSDHHDSPAGPPVIVASPQEMPVIVSEPPLFLQPARLGFWVAVDVPYDMVFISGHYYLNNGDHWYASSRYNGPWTAVVHEQLPPGLRKHKYAKIREYRDREYISYRKQGNHYQGQSYWPEEKEHGEHPGKGKGKGHNK